MTCEIFAREFQSKWSTVMRLAVDRGTFWNDLNDWNRRFKSDLWSEFKIAWNDLERIWNEFGTN